MAGHDKDKREGEELGFVSMSDKGASGIYGGGGQTSRSIRQDRLNSRHVVDMGGGWVVLSGDFIAAMCAWPVTLPKSVVSDKSKGKGK